MKVKAQLLKSFLLPCCLLVSNFCCGAAVITSPKESIGAEFSARGIGRTLAHCFGGNEKLKCIELQMLNALEAAVRDNTTWHYSDFLAFEPTTANGNESSAIFLNVLQHGGRQQRSFSDAVGEKLLQLAQTRSMRFRLPKKLYVPGISDAVDDLYGISNESLSADEGSKKSKKKKKKYKKKKKKIKKHKKKIWYLFDKNPLKGRKKKHKDKHMAMMGGMAMMAMVAQLFLGKVILIAGAAFVFAKIALIIAVLGSLKKGGSTGSSGSTDHVIVTNAGGGGGGGGGHSHGGHSSHDSGWHRSLPYDPIISVEHDSEFTPVTDHEAEPMKPPAEHAPAMESGTLNPSYYQITETEDAEKKRRRAAVFL